MPKSLSMQIPTSFFKKSTESNDSVKPPLKAQGSSPHSQLQTPSKLRASTPRSLNTVSAAINLLDYCSMK